MTLLRLIPHTKMVPLNVIGEHSLKWQDVCCYR